MTEGGTAGAGAGACEGGGVLGVIGGGTAAGGSPPIVATSGSTGVGTGLP